MRRRGRPAQEPPQLQQIGLVLVIVEPSRRGFSQQPSNSGGGALAGKRSCQSALVAPRAMAAADFELSLGQRSHVPNHMLTVAGFPAEMSLAPGEPERRRSRGAPLFQRNYLMRRHGLALFFSQRAMRGKHAHISSGSLRFAFSGGFFACGLQLDMGLFRRRRQLSAGPNL